MFQPDQVMVFTGKQKELRQLNRLLVDDGVFTPLNDELFPGSFMACSDPLDVARAEADTIIATAAREDAGPLNNWADPDQLQKALRAISTGLMQGRTMYVVPYCMGPPDHPMAQYGVLVTDSAYVCVNMAIMARVSPKVLKRIKGGNVRFVCGLHSVGVPLFGDHPDSSWPCNPGIRKIAHFPEHRIIWSIGSGYGGNALLGKKCHALRIGSSLARSEGWMAEHMAILGLRSPEGEVKYFMFAAPSACGKSNLAMLKSMLPGWTVTTLGDDIAWCWVQDGQLWAINPETGFFGVAPGTSLESNPHMMAALAEKAIFTNVAFDQRHQVPWWEGLPEAQGSLLDWRGNPWRADSATPAAHPNARFTAPISQCPVLDPQWEEGVPISGIIFGTRRPDTVPLVCEARNWQEGVFAGATMGSQLTAAQEGAVGNVRRDPMAMRPFCGYDIAQYFGHWLSMGARLRTPPRIFVTNWFQVDDKGRFLWPGFADNVRALQWMFRRCSGEQLGEDTALGFVPRPEEIDVTGLQIDPEDLKAVLEVHHHLWRPEVDQIQAFFDTLGDKLPPELLQRLGALKTATGG
jgi:phosphoenolpyruvate carboxykinase (GTP)